MTLTPEQQIAQANAMIAQTKAQGSASFAGSSYDTTPVVQASPVSVISSNAGQKIVDTNTNNLQKIESGYTGNSIVDFLAKEGKASDYASRAKLAKENGIVGYTGSAGQNTQLLNTLKNISGSPASGAMIDNINNSTGSGIGMTSAEQQGLSDLTATQDAVTAAAAKARAALDAKDYKSMDYWTAKADENKKLYEKQLSDYHDQTKTLRDAVASAAIPGAAEQKIQQDLAGIRAQADAFALQTQKDKFDEFSGQTMGFATGRAAGIDRNAEFAKQTMALKEKNLLTSLGIEQAQQKAEGDAAKTQLGYLADDFALQQTVQDKLDQQEENLFNKADKLETESKNTLISMLDALQGVDPTHMDANSLKQLETMAARAGIPFDLVKSALTTQYNKQVFEDSIKRQNAAKANQPTTSEKDAAAVADANKQLTAAKGDDGYTDPNLYARLRATSTLSGTDFDNRFAYLINPKSRAKLGLTATNASETKYTGEQIKQTIFQQMATPEWKTANKDIQRSYILSLGADPADFGL